MNLFELDHIFIWCDVAAPEAERLIAFGLSEGDPNVHPGQGTANRRFFFHNAFLELIWVADPQETQSDLVTPTQIWPRWCARHSVGSPFGVCLRRARPDVNELPFPCWEYRPPYLPEPLAIHVGSDVPLTEPWWGYLAFGRPPHHPDWPRRQPLEHRSGFREITHARFTTVGSGILSAAGSAATRTGQLSLHTGTEHLLDLTFDDGTNDQCHDFRPVLPLVFRW